MSMQNSPARSPVDVGSVIAGTYTIEALIGRGGMGAVFLASHTRLPGKKVAIKVLHDDMSSDEVLARFKREAQIASMLSHPNIVHIEDYNVTADGMPYLVLEYLQGESLAQRLRNGPMPLDAAFSIIRQVGSALAAAHAKGIVHRDLKPQNIFLVPSQIDGRTMEIAKVLDFGISKIRDSQTVKTQDSALLGTPQYMAPEQAKGDHERVDERTDVFALGAIVYEMLSGHAAFGGQSIPEVVFKVVYEQPVELATRAPSVPDTVRTAVTRAMAKAAEERYSNVSSFVEALTGSPLSTVRPAPLPPPEVGFASGSVRAPNTGQDAFAHTVGSGNHGSSPAAEATMASPVAGKAPAAVATMASPVAGNAPTVDSQSRRAEAHLGHAGTVSAERRIEPPTVSPASAPPSRRTPWIIVGVLAAAAAAAGIMFVLMREEPAAQQVARVDEPAPVAIEKPLVEKAEAPVEKPAVGASVDKPVEAPAGSNTPRIDVAAAGSGSAAIKTPDKPAVKPRGDTKKPVEAPVEDSGGDDTRAAKKLREAERALANREWARAEEHANVVFASEDAGLKQKQAAAMVQGIVACVHRNAEEDARSRLRMLKGSPLMRKRLLDACHSAGYLVGTR